MYEENWTLVLSWQKFGHTILGKNENLKVMVISLYRPSSAFYCNEWVDGQQNSWSLLYPNLNSFSNPFNQHERYHISTEFLPGLYCCLLGISVRELQAPGKTDNWDLLGMTQGREPRPVVDYLLFTWTVALSNQLARAGLRFLAVPVTISAHIFTTFHEPLISSFFVLFWDLTYNLKKSSEQGYRPLCYELHGIIFVPEEK